MFSRKKSDLEIAQNLFDEGIAILYKHILWKNDLDSQDSKTLRDLEQTLKEAQDVYQQILHSAENRAETLNSEKQSKITG